MVYHQNAVIISKLIQIIKKSLTEQNHNKTMFMLKRVSPEIIELSWTISVSYRSLLRISN